MGMRLFGQKVSEKTLHRKLSFREDLRSEIRYPLSAN